MKRIRRRDLAAAFAIALIAGAIAVLPAVAPLRGWSIDALTALRWRVFGERRAPAESPVVVIALDEESSRTPPFKGSPILAWTREIGRVVTAVVEGGAGVVGFDVVFAASIEESDIPFGDETLGAKVRGFDRDFLRALAVPARAGKIVLGEVQFGDQPIVPTAGQRIAVGLRRNIRGLNVYSDADDVVRRIPLTLLVDGERVPAMAIELAARALNAEPEFGDDGSLRLAGYRIPSAVANTMTLNFEGGSNDIPTYSLADLRACLEKGDKEFFRRNFQGKVVLIGSALDSADRLLTSKRFATTPAAAPAERCAAPAAPPSAVSRESIDGVYVQATAVGNLLRREALTEISVPLGGIVAAAAAAIASLAATALAPAAAVVSLLALALAWVAAATLAFEKAVALPLFEPLLFGALALAATMGLRLTVIDREKRFLRKAFAHYLSPAVIEKMVASSVLPTLGGETRTITILFSDVVGFSTLSENMKPTEIVALMNEYLSAMTDVIEERGGFVDKYVGDAIVAIFGAPVDAADHAVDAVNAALQCRERLAELNRTAPERPRRLLRHRIGLNSGQALVGNIGSRRRFNYTAFGDSVNLASRLEEANNHFGTDIIASETTMALTRDVFAWRELDAVRVKGRVQPVNVYEPLAARGRESLEQAARAEAYACGLAAWRKRDFARAAEHFALLADDDPPAALFLARSKAMIERPPDPGWEPIHVLERK